MDCMDGMKQFPDKFFDIAIVDPPYGINVAAHRIHTMRFGRYVGDAPKPYHTFNDNRPPDEGYFLELERVSKHRIIWGGNFMLDHLGKASCMIIWDKKRRNLDQADCEIAWTDLPGQSRIFEYKWNGMLVENMKDKQPRIHPCEKPVMLYSWILGKWAKSGDKILDTHVGSANSLVACHRGGFQYWGFEIDPVYYDMAKARLDRETAQVRMTFD